MDRFQTEPLEIDGKKYPVLRVTRTIRGRLKESAHLWQKERLRDNLGLAGAPPGAVVAELNAFDQRSVADRDLIAYLNTDIGTDEAIRALLAECGEGAEPGELAERIDDPIAFLVRHWPGLTPAPVDEAPQASPGEDAAANPQHPPTFNPPRT